MCAALCLRTCAHLHTFSDNIFMCAALFYGLAHTCTPLLIDTFIMCSLCLWTCAHLRRPCSFWSETWLEMGHKRGDPTSLPSSRRLFVWSQCPRNRVRYWFDRPTRRLCENVRQSGEVEGKGVPPVVELGGDNVDQDIWRGQGSQEEEIRKHSDQYYIIIRSHYCFNVGKIWNRTARG